MELAQAAANSDAKLREEVRELRYVLTRLAERRVPVSAALGGAGIGSRSTGVLDGNLAAWMTPGSPETGGHIAVPQARAVAHSNSVVTMAELERQLAELREGLKRLKGGTEEEKDDVEKK